MTLTRVLPSLRRSIPDPLLRDAWPELSSATTTDVFVAGLSLLRLVEVCGTPCVHSGAAVLPGTGGRPSATEKTAVLVVRVTAAVRHSSGRLAIQTDARLDELRLVWSEMRLINRASTAHTGQVLVSKGIDSAALAGLPMNRLEDVDLPLDLVAGDLLAIPSRPIATTWALRPHPLTGTFESFPSEHTPGAALSTEVPAWLALLR